MADQALGLVVRLRGHDVSMGVVAGHAIEPVLALGVAAAPCQRRPLEPDRGGVVRFDRLAPGAVTLGTDLDHARAGGQAGTGDCQVGELGGDGDQMIASRAMALLTANRMVRCLGTRRREDSLGIGDMA